MFGAACHRSGANPWRAHGNQSVPQVTIEPQRLRTLFRLVWQIPTVAWIACGVLLIAAPSMASESARHWMIVTFACVFAFCAFGNAWGTRGKHFGWMLLVAVAVLAVAGY
jgi:hypothetical protein